MIFMRNSADAWIYQSLALQSGIEIICQVDKKTHTFWNDSNCNRMTKQTANIQYFSFEWSLKYIIQSKMCAGIVKDSQMHC